MSNLLLRSATRHVRDFADESELMREHVQAMDCRDCEAYLQIGIDAFEWLIRADENFRAIVFSEKAEYDPRIDQAIQSLFRAWLPPCEFANQWIDSQLQSGYHPDNLAKFRECERQVRSIVRSLDQDSDEMTDEMRSLRDAALREHLHGETAEFV